MLGTSALEFEGLLANIWIISCALGGLAFLLIGARAAGLALLGAVVGAIVGFLLVSSDFDRLAQGALVGATIGTFVGGLVGLAWRPSASAAVLLALGSVTILVGVLSVHVLGLWNQFLLPVALNTKRENYVLSQGMASFASQAGYNVDYGRLFAAVVITVVPVPTDSRRRTRGRWRPGPPGLPYLRHCRMIPMCPGW